MKLLKLGLALGASALLGTSAHAQKVTEDQSHDANFSDYHTFLWVKEPRMRDS